MLGVGGEAWMRQRDGEMRWPETTGVNDEAYDGPYDGIALNSDVAGGATDPTPSTTSSGGIGRACQQPSAFHDEFLDPRSYPLRLA